MRARLRDKLIPEQHSSDALRISGIDGDHTCTLGRYRCSSTMGEYKARGMDVSREA